MIEPSSNEATGDVAARIRREVAAMLGEPEDGLDTSVRLADLGIDSLYRVELEMRLETEFGIIVDPTRLGADATLEDVITETIRALGQPPGGSVPKTGVEIEAGVRVPLTPGQLEFLEESNDRFERYALVLSLRTPPDLDIDALTAALYALEHHDALRLRFHRRGSEWIQEYGKAGTSIGFRRTDARDADDEQARRLGSRFVAETAGDFDLARGPVMRAELLDRGPGEHGLLLLSIHHLIADGASIPILLAGLEHGYQGGTIAAPAMSYAAWANRLHALAQSDAVARDVAYWQRAGSSAETRGGGEGTFETTPVLSLTPDESRQFIGRHPTSQAQHDALLAGLARSWMQLSGQQSLTVRLETHGRLPLQGPEPLQTVGWFASSFPIRIEGDVGELSQLRALVDAAPHFGMSFGLLKYACQDRDIRRHMRALPVPQAALAYRGRWLDFFREDCRFPVIARHVINDTVASPACCPALSLFAGIENRRLWTYLMFDPKSYEAGSADRLLSAIREHVTAASVG